MANKELKTKNRIEKRRSGEMGRKQPSITKR